MTPTDFALILGAALSLHRIWNYEPICAWFRDKLKNIKVLSCPACNAFWIGLISVAVWYFVPIVAIALTAFFFARASVWIYERKSDDTKTVKTSTGSAVPAGQLSSRQVVTPAALPSPLQVKLPPEITSPVVSTAPSTRPDHVVIVMTALRDLRDSYSVAQEAVNTARSIALANPTWSVRLWTMQGCKMDKTMPSNVFHQPVFPVIATDPDKENPEIIQLLVDIIKFGLQAPGQPISVITHDLLFVAHFINFAKAIHQVGDKPGVRWWHVCHSTAHPTANTPEARRTVPSTDHTIVTVAEHGVQAFKDYYKTSQVISIPNVRDPRMFGLSAAVIRIVTAMKLNSASIVQILPADSTRLESKGFIRIARVFAELNKRRPAKLIVCNPNATGRGVEVLKRIREQAKEAGLEDDQWCLTSDLIPETSVMGLPSLDIMHLMLFYGNVFVLPSHGEADSLTLLEARLARQFTVVNSSVDNLVFADAELGIPWGEGNDYSKDKANAEFVAHRIADHFVGDTLSMSRGDVLSTRNLEVIGNIWTKTLNVAGSST